MATNKDSTTPEKVQDEDTGGAVRLKRRFGVMNSVAIIMGLIISTTIFISPTGVIKETHDGGVALVVWVLCGAMSMMGALIFVELGLTYPTSGGMYVYLEEFFGPGVAFLFLWSYYLFHRPAANAVKVLTLAIYLLHGAFLECDSPGSAVVLLAILVASLVVFINMVNLKVIARFQNTMLVLVILSLIFVTAVAIYHAASGGQTHLDNLFENINPNIADLALAFYPGLYTFGGWEALNYLIEEVKNPKRTLPMAVCISVLLVTVLYVSVNISYMAVIGEEGIMSSQAVAATMLHKAIGAGFLIMPVLTTFAGVSSFNSGTLVGSRLGYVSARRGHLPAVLSLVHVKFLTPITSLILQLILVILFCTVGDVYFILRNVGFAYSTFQALTMVGFIYQRIKYPNLERPLKIPLVVAVLYLLLLLFLLIVPLVTKPMSCVIGLALCIGTGLPYYIIFVVRPLNLKTLDRLAGKFLIWTQKTLAAALPDKDPFLEE